jgi:hypothetical protein
MKMLLCCGIECMELNDSMGLASHIYTQFNRCSVSTELMLDLYVSDSSAEVSIIPTVSIQTRYTQS